MNEKFNFLCSKFEGIEITESQIKENQNSIDQLDNILEKESINIILSKVLRNVGPNKR